MVRDYADAGAQERCHRAHQMNRAEDHDAQGREDLCAALTGKNNSWLHEQQCRSPPHRRPPSEIADLYSQWPAWQVGFATSTIEEIRRSIRHSWSDAGSHWAAALDA